MGHDCNGVNEKRLEVSINELTRKDTGRILKRTRYSSLIQTVFRLVLLLIDIRLQIYFFKDWEGVLLWHGRIGSKFFLGIFVNHGCAFFMT